VLAVIAFYGLLPIAAILWLPIFLLVVLLTAVCVGLWLSAFNVPYRDVRIVHFLMLLWMFARRIAYPISQLPQRYQWLDGLNAVAGISEGESLVSLLHKRTRP
jgi:lipopolysaccharide transport system permease protein